MKDNEEEMFPAVDENGMLFHDVGTQFLAELRKLVNFQLAQVCRIGDFA